MEINTRVLAIESFKSGVMRSYGEGIYLGNLFPDYEPFKSVRVKNPCIKLDSGKHIWGFECWWGSVDKVREKYKDKIKEEIIVDVVDEILLLKEEKKG